MPTLQSPHHGTGAVSYACKRSGAAAIVLILLVLSGCMDNQTSNPSFVPTKMDLPVLRLTTAGGAAVTSEDDYLNGHMTLTAPDGSDYPVVDSDLEIKGHGNSSWGWAKKPYKVKLNSKASLLGMPTEKNWVLLANFDDKTLMRDDVAFELSRRVGMAWSPRSQFIELFMNGEYEGSYQLTEEVEIDDNRVDINSLDPTDLTGKAVTGGYLMEVDYNSPQNAAFNIGNIIPLTMHDPSPMAPEQQTYIQNYLNQVQSTLYGPNFANPKTGYAQYLDVDSFIGWYLVNEIFKNNDAIWYSSVYMYKARNGLLSCGPVWDFDIGAGNTTENQNSDPTGWWVRNPSVANGQWMAQLFQDPAFRAKVKVRWNQLKATQFDTLTAYIDQRAGYLNQTQRNNFARWPVFETVIFTEPELAGTYPGEVAYMKTWLKTRIAWMDTQINSESY